MIKPLFDRVLLKNAEQEASETGIYVPKDTLERSLTMQVIAVGDGSCEDGAKIVVSVGDIVIVGKYTGTEVVYGNQKFWIVTQCDILAKLNNTEGEY